MSKEIAVFAGGCFWCMVEPFETRPGILSVTSGYTGGMSMTRHMMKYRVNIRDTLKLWR